MLTKYAELLDDRTARIVKHYALGGAALGGTAALITSLLNYFKSREKEDKRNKEDDDTLYVYKNTEQEKSAGVDVGLAIPAAVLSAIGSYWLGKDIYTNWRASEAQKKLDDAQNIFLEAEGYTPIGSFDDVKKKEQEKLRRKSKSKSNDSQEKKAADGRPVDFLENVTSLPVAVPLLIALGTGIAANKFLELKYPLKKPKIKAPRRIEVYNSPIPEEKDDEETEEEKSASIQADVGELLVRTFLMEKSAGVSDIKNLVKSFATGGRKAFCKAAEDIGFVNALDTVKGASERVSDPFMDNLAIMYLCKEAKLAPQVFTVAVGEFAEKYPTILKQASCLTENQQEFLLDLTRAVGAASRSEIISEYLPLEPGEKLEKVAAIEAMDVIGTTLDALSEDNSPVIKGNTDSEAETTQESGDSNENGKKKHKVKIVGSKTSKKLLMDLEPDLIDKILLPSNN